MGVVLSITHAHKSSAAPRFGVGLAKCRTQAEKRHRRMAKRFLKEAKQSENKADTSRSANNAWIKGAQLESVIQFLSH